MAQEDTRKPREDGGELARDVRRLGNALGEVLREQGGEALFETVERIRALTKEARTQDGSDAAEAELDRLFAGMDFPTALPVLKAFTTYFQLINLAEHEGDRPGQPAAGGGGGRHAPARVGAGRRPGDVRGGRDGGADAGTWWRRCPFNSSSRPTRPRRSGGACRRRLHRLSRYLSGLEQPLLSRPERERLKAHIKAETEILWQTDEVRQRRLSVLDEAGNILFYFDETLFDVTPRLLEDLQAALAECYPGETFDIGPFLEYGSWVGGDRDGNPTITLAHTREIVRRAQGSGTGEIHSGRAEAQRPPEPVPALRRRLRGAGTVAA